MRKILSLFTLLMFVGTVAFGQLRDVTGQVVNESNNPVPGASVRVKGASSGITADDNGRFSLRVKNGSSLLVSAIGFKDGELAIGTQTNVTIKLVKSIRDEEVVVVTGAMNIKKSQRNQVASAQTLTAEQINTTRQPNLVNGLAGKVVGTQARSQSTAKLDEAATLRIRGGSSLSGDRGAIFVVDGTIVNSFDINPDDIESTTVLKGANATVLFGDRAANGAVVITTRKKTKSKMLVELNQSVTFEDVNITMDYQNKYAGGSGGWRTFNYQAGMPASWQALNGQRYHDYTDDASWGPRIDGGQYVPWYAWVPGHKYSGKTTALVAQPSNINEFWRTGVTTNTNVSLFKTVKKGNFRISYNNTQIKGILPNSKSGRNTFTFSGGYDIVKNLTLSANVNYSLNKIRGDFNDGYSNNSTGSFSSWFHRNLDFKIMKELRNIRTPIGTLASWNPRINPNSVTAASVNNFWRANYWYNPYSYYDNVDYDIDRDRLFGDVRLAYKITKDWNVSATVRNNTLNTDRENITRSILENSALQTGTLADYTTDDTKFQENNYEFLTNYRKSYKKFDFDYLLGANILDQKNYRDFATTDGGLTTPDLYTLANSKNPVIRNAKGPGNLISHIQNRAWFTQLDVNYNKFLNLTGAVRQDWYSVLRPEDNKLTSYSYGAGFIFSDLLKERASWISYGKIYGSIGQKPLSGAVGFGQVDYRYFQDGSFLTYTPATTYFGNDTLMSTPNVPVDGKISGIVVRTNEVGLDLKFLRNRFGINVVYYDELIDKEPVAVSVPGTSGYTARVANAGKLLRKGLEFELFVQAIKKKDFDWRVDFNIAKILNNNVEDVDGDTRTNSNRILLAGGAFGTRFARAFQVEGKPAGQLIGGGIMRNADGKAMINADGLFAVDATKEWGSIVPTVTGGFFNTIRYGNFNAAVNIDYQFGGKFFSLSESWGTFSGLLDWTATVNDRGMEVRDAVAAGGGIRVVGVSAADGKTPIDMYVDAQTYFQQFYNNQIAEPFVHSLSFIKLREISLGYNIPLNKWKNSKWVKGATFSVISRNPMILYREAKNFDPSEISALYGEDGNLPATRSLGVNLKLTF